MRLEVAVTWLFLVLASACSEGPNASRPADPTQKDPTALRDGLVGPQDAASQPAPVPISPQLVGAPAWVMRRLDGGILPSPQVLETFTLRRYGRQALLTMDVQHANGSLSGTISPWSAIVSTVQYVGTFNDAAGDVTLDVSHGTDALHFRCKATEESVASATAVRRRGKRGRNEGGCNGETGHWEPAKTTMVAVLRCELPEGFQEAHGWSIPYLAFTAAPGIEWLWVNDDCAMQGGGWRRITDDGTIAPFRSAKDAR